MQRLRLRALTARRRLVASTARGRLGRSTARSFRPGRLRALAAVLLAGLLLSAVPPAAAHESDPQVETVLSAVVPALPSGVVVQVAAGVAAQLVADNPTDTVLEVLGASGRPFLRLSSAGVEGDLGSPDFLTTSNPVGGEAGRAGPPRWTLLSRGTSWGWFDHRLHPADVRAPADRSRPQQLGTWTVPLRYGDRPVEVSGQVRYRPLRGTVQVTADPAPEGLDVQVLQGRLPGLFLSAAPERRVVVEGVDGEPFVELGAVNRLNTASRTHVLDRQARGEQAGPPAAVPAYAELAGPTHSWLDGRLAPAAAVPEAVARAGEPAVLQRWEVPVVVDGRPAALTGEVRWVPSADLERAVSTGAPEQGGSSAALWLGAGALAALAAVVLVVRRRRSA